MARWPIGVSFERNCVECNKLFTVAGRDIKRGFLRSDSVYIHPQKSKWCGRTCFLTWRNREDNPARSNAARKRISAFAKNRGTSFLNTPEAKAKQSATITGRNHWNWQGGDN